MNEADKKWIEGQTKRLELLLHTQLAETTAAKAVVQALLIEAVCRSEGGSELMQAITDRVKSTLTPRADATADQKQFHSMASQAAKSILEPLQKIADEYGS